VKFKHVTDYLYHRIEIIIIVLGNNQNSILFTTYKATTSITNNYKLAIPKCLVTIFNTHSISNNNIVNNYI